MYKIYTSVLLLTITIWKKNSILIMVYIILKVKSKKIKKKKKKPPSSNIKENTYEKMLKLDLN